MADRLEQLLQFWSEPEDRDGKLNVWSTLKLDGQFFPGKDDIDDPGVCIAIPTAVRRLVTDKLKNIASNKTRQIHHGYAAAEIEIEIRIWTIEQWRAYLNYLPKIDPARKARRTVKKQVTVAAAGPPAPVESVVAVASVGDVEQGTALVGPEAVKRTESKTVEEIPAHTIDHPDLAPLGITHIYITEISTPGPEEDGGVRTIRIRGLEIVKPASGDKPQTKGVSAGERLNNDQDVLPEFKLNLGPRLAS